jgi:hypothetical protein
MNMCVVSASQSRRTFTPVKQGMCMFDCCQGHFHLMPISRRFKFSILSASVISIFSLTYLNIEFGENVDSQSDNLNIYRLEDRLHQTQSEDFTFATYIELVPSRKEYWKGLLTLLESFHQTNSKFSFQIYSRNPILNEMKKMINAYRNVHFVFINSTVDSTGETSWHSSFNKLISWRDTRFKKIALIDSDIIFSRNADEMKYLPIYSGAHEYENCKEIAMMNAGVFIFQPDESNFNKMMTYSQMESCISKDFKWKDQELLNCLTIPKYFNQTKEFYLKVT